MKKIIVWTSAVAVLASLSPVLWNAWGQPQGQKKTKSSEQKIGLIDMAYLFKNYKKFEILREDLKGEISQTDSQAKGMVQKIKNLQNKLKSGTWKEESPEYIQAEKELARLTSEYQITRKSAQRDFLRKESQIYKTIYMEALDAIEQYADYYNYTLILRFNREGLDSSDPKKLLQGLNRQVVFHRKEDDITAPVLDYLNRKYQAQAQGNNPKRQGPVPKRTSQGGSNRIQKR